MADRGGHFDVFAKYVVFKSEYGKDTVQSITNIFLKGKWKNKPINSEVDTNFCRCCWTRG